MIPQALLRQPENCSVNELLQLAEACQAQTDAAQATQVYATLQKDVWLQQSPCGP